VTLNLDRTVSDKALDLLGALVLEDGRPWGEAATAEQWEDARAVLDPAGAPYSYLTRSRGYSKTTDLAGIVLAAMHEQIPPGSRAYGLASDRDQGRLLTDALAGFVARTPALRDAITVDSYAATTRSGTRLEVLAADVAGSWGLLPAFLIVDELAQWGTTAAPRALWEATTSALTKAKGARLVVLTSAGDPAHWSHGILEHARVDPLWRVHEVGGPPPWADPARLAEQRRRLPASVYARLFENVWTASEDRLTSLGDLRACVTLDGPQEPRRGALYRIGLDLGLKSDRTVAAVCHGERDGSDTRVVLDRMAVWQGSKVRPVDLGEVEAWVFEASRRYNHAHLCCDPWQAVGLCQRLRMAGVVVTEYAFSQQSIGRLATTLHTTIRDHHLALYDDDELVDELANVRLRETSPGVLRMDHDGDRHDDRAIALALAVQEIVGTADQGAGFLEFWRREIAERDDPVAAMTTSQRAIAQTQRALARAEQMAAKRQRPRCPGHLFSPETRLCHVCGEAAPEHAA
jgi:phage terminase large subunit-like protein